MAFRSVRQASCCQPSADSHQRRGRAVGLYLDRRDRPPSDSQAKQVEIRVNTYTAPAEVIRASATYAERSAIVIYTTERCGYCRQAKAFLNANRVPFKEYDVENSPRGRADYRKLSGRGVPIILVGEQRMNGYSENGLVSLLRDAGYQL